MDWPREYLKHLLQDNDLSQFKQQYLCERIIDEEYNYLLSLWVEYRKRTHDMPRSMNREAMKIHKELFYGIGKGEKYKLAKRESLRQF